MQIGMIGLGRMGSNMVQRLLAGGHECVVYDPDESSRTKLAAAGALAVDSLQAMVKTMPSPRPIWIMVPDSVVDQVIQDLSGHLQPGDILIDGGNSYFRDDVRRAARLAPLGIAYSDVGTSGGVWGLERGYCLMIGGQRDTINHLAPLFETLSPAQESVADTPGWNGAQSTAARGWLHCGGHGAGHFVKMIHNGIEYGMMAAYSEGFAMLHKAGTDGIDVDSEHADTRVQLDVATGEIAELWRRGSVVGSWLLDLTSQSLLKDSNLEQFSDEVSDSGEGRWTVKTAAEMGVPAQVLTAALFQRFSSRGEADYANRMLSALRYAFGGHNEKG